MCTSESVYVCFQAQGRRPSSGCWPVGSDLTEEVSLSLRRSRIKPDAPTDPELCLSGDIPILNVSYKPQTISPKFKVSSRFLTADPRQDHPSACFTAFSLLIILVSKLNLQKSRVQSPKSLNKVEADFDHCSYHEKQTKIWYIRLNVCSDQGPDSDGVERVLRFQGSVRALLHEKIRDAYTHPQFITDVMKPMQIESIIDQDVRETQTFSFGYLSEGI